MTVSNNSPDDEVFTLRDLLANYLALARRGLRYWMRGALVFTAIFVIGMVVVLQRPRVYKSEAAFQVQDSNTAQREEQGEETQQRSIEGRLNQIYGSRRYVMNIVRELHLYDHLLGVGPDGRPFTSEAKIVQQFQSAMDSRVERTIVHLGFVYKDPLRAQQVVQALIRLFVNERKMAAEEQARDMLQLVDGQLRELEGVLAQRQDALDRFTLANQEMVERVQMQRGVGTGPAGGQRQAPSAPHDPTSSTGTRRLRSRVSSLEGDLNALRNPGSSSSNASSDDTPEISALRGRVADKRNQVNALRARGMTPDHPTRASSERELADLESELNAAVARVRGAARERQNLSEAERASRIERVTRELQQAREELSASERADAAARAGAGAVPSQPAAAPARAPGVAANIVEVASTLDRLTNELSGTRNAYNDLLRRKLERQSDLRRIQLAGGETVRIIDPPSRPVEPEPPGRTKLAAIVIFLAMLFGLGTALVSGFIDSRVYDLTDLRRWGELPELPFIPELHLDAPGSRSAPPPPRGG